MNTPEDMPREKPDEPPQTEPAPVEVDPQPLAAVSPPESNAESPPHSLAPEPEPEPAASPEPEIRYLEDPPPQTPTERHSPSPPPPPPKAPAPQPKPAVAPRPAPPSAAAPAHQQQQPTKLDVHLSLPNAMVGKPYDTTAPLTIRKASGLPAGVRPEDLSVIAQGVEGLERLGLKAEINGEQIRVFGEPNEDGDHAFFVTLAVRKQGKDWATARKSFSLTINPDPRSLWKEIEPDSSAPFRRPHTQKERIVGNSVLLGASRRGRSHANKGDHRDDAFLLKHMPDRGWYGMAVADGAGGHPLSRRGAELACESACETIRTYLTTTLDGPFLDLLAAFAKSGGDEDRNRIRNALYSSLGDVGRRAYLRIEEEARAVGTKPEDFSTTLILAIAREFPFGWFVAAIAVGDGGVGIYRRESGVTLLSTPDSGDYAGQTRFVTMSKIWTDGQEIIKRIKFAIVPEFTAVVAMTDGVSDPKFGSDRDFADADKWHAFWADLSGSVELTKENEEADAQLLEWLNFWAVGNHDDRTIAILLP